MTSSFITLFHHVHCFLKATFLTLLSNYLLPSLSIFLSTLLLIITSFYLFRHHRKSPTFLLDFSCYLPPPNHKCNLQLAEHFVTRTNQYSPQSIEFMRNIFIKSGLGPDTYLPPFFFSHNKPHYQNPTLNWALLEAHEGMFTAINSLLSKTQLNPAQIGYLIVTCGTFSPEPSLSSLLVNRYKFRDEIKEYNLSGMGCSGGVLAIDLAAKLVSTAENVVNKYALVVITENMSSNWYFGDNRSMLVTNCIFRVGCAAVIVTSDLNRRGQAKFELLRSLRTHHGSDDTSYRAAFQEEDEKGNTGVALTKDLIRVAGKNLRDHIQILAPRVLPFSQLAAYAKSLILCKLLSLVEKMKPTMVPDFTSAFDHICIHTGGKAVIDQVSKELRLEESVTEPARMTLHRFGNTSSSLVLYELAYFEAKGRVKKGDRMWMLAFGTGFKVGSLIWRAVRDLDCDEGDNPWRDCIDRYPLKI